MIALLLVLVAAQAPDFHAMLARVNAGENVDWRELRVAFAQSDAAVAALKQRTTIRELHGKLFRAIAKNDVRLVLSTAEEILKISPLDLEALKARYQSCAALERKECAERGKEIELGLLKSVVEGADGKSCKTAWTVVTVEEEYFVMRMLGDSFVGQRLVTEDGNPCDEMRVKDQSGNESLRYFNVNWPLQIMQRAYPIQAPPTTPAEPLDVDALLKKCDAKDDAACTRLGDAFASGQGVPFKNLARAKAAYEAACQRGYVRACEGLQAVKTSLGER